MTILARMITTKLKAKEGINLHEQLIDQILQHRDSILKEEETSDRTRGIYDKDRYITTKDGRKVKIQGE